MKKFKATFSILFVFFLCTAVSGIHASDRPSSQSPEWISFYWESDSISGKYIEKAYMYVPVKIENLPYDFSMQLDLGTSETRFYEIPLKPYLKESASLRNKLGPYMTAENAIFKDVDLQMGSVDFQLDLWHHHDFGEEIPEESIHSNTPKHIGTIASDIFQDKIVVIDYKSCRFAVADCLPAEYADLPAVEFELINGITLLPFRINGKESRVMFDSGASPFPLATSKERAMEISDSVIIDSLSGPLWWGQDITFYGLKVNKPIELAGQTLQKGIVYYDKEGLWDKEVFKPFDIWGLSGNAYFFNHVIILDYKNRLLRLQR